MIQTPVIATPPGLQYPGLLLRVHRVHASNRHPLHLHMVGRLQYHNNSDKENARPSPRTDDDLLRPVHPGVRAFSEPCGRATTPLHDLYPPGSQRRRNSSPEVLRHKPSFKADFSFNPTREPLAPLTNSYLQDVDVRVPTAAVSPRDKISFTKPQSQSPQLQTTPPRKTVPIAQYNPTFDRYSQVTPEQYDDPFADIIGLNDDQPCAFSPENRYISAPSKRQLKKRKRTQDTSDSVVEENWTCLSFCLGGRECWSCQTKRATTSNTLINPLETPPPPPPRTLFPHNGSRTPSPLRLTGSPPTSSPMAPNLTSTNNNTNPPRTPTTPTSPRSPEITAYRKRIKSDPEIEPFDGSADHDWEQPSKRLRLSITKKLEIDPKRAAILSPGDEITREVRSVTVKREEDSPIKSRWLMGAPSPSPTAPKGGSETPIPSSKTGGVTEGSKKDMGFFPAGFVWGGLLSQP
ncbi:hypothetical protein QBC46DRAFT_354296 [Diplogelasinospora grovesii]|uniref:Uncharacterized protein n=1 Tax=Diplogelasinospora grovesii TaxID=303347 RepID=A0AAN6S4K7_9PEZI|nr:hypothetical protein QBC46DRAFT_354296 [Diplogelasinospora grovesii]